MILFIFCNKIYLRNLRIWLHGNVQTAATLLSLFSKLAGNVPGMVQHYLTIQCAWGKRFCCKICLHPSLKTCPKWKNNKKIPVCIYSEKFLELGSWTLQGFFSTKQVLFLGWAGFATIFSAPIAVKHTFGEPVVCCLCWWKDR